MSSRNICEKCEVRIPKNRPQLKCSHCDIIKHYRCNNLTKREAAEIIEKFPLWTCPDCLYNSLPLNAPDTTNVIRVTCPACCTKIKPSSVVATCVWCDSCCHKDCIIGPLGCKQCCNKYIPGFNCYAHELFDASYLDARPLFNPWDQEHLINQLGLNSVAQDEQTAWNELSHRLSQCQYSALKDLPSNSDGSPRVLSLNIRSLVKSIDKLRESVDLLKAKCDVICLCETP